MRVSKFIHKAFIEVDDEGLDAPVDTDKPSPKKKEKSFHAERPFMFAIRKPSETLLLGCIRKL